jgi:hypothetical protein
MVDECHDYPGLRADPVQAITELCDHLLVTDVISNVTHQRINPRDVWLVFDDQGFEYSKELRPGMHVVAVKHQSLVQVVPDRFITMVLPVLRDD